MIMTETLLALSSGGVGGLLSSRKALSVIGLLKVLWENVKLNFICKVADKVALLNLTNKLDPACQPPISRQMSTLSGSCCALTIQKSIGRLICH